MVVTDAGQELLTGAPAWQDETFAALTHGWATEDAVRFGSYLRRLADEQLDPGAPG